jgi:hypothetical protein
MIPIYLTRFSKFMFLMEFSDSLLMNDGMNGF